MCLFMAMLNSCCSEGFSVVVSGRGYSLAAVWRLLLLWNTGSEYLGFVVATRGLGGFSSWALGHRLGSCGARA